MIGAQPNRPTQERLIDKLMELPNNAVSRAQHIVQSNTNEQWDNLMSQAAHNIDVLSNPDNVKIMSNILKTNVSACSSIGTFFLPQLGKVWLDMLGLYRAVSGIISAEVGAQGELRRCILCRVAHTPRSGRDQDAQGAAIADDQEGDSQAGRHVRAQGRGPRRRQQEPDPGAL
jgi:hypothetical protein